jgi:hypothetical protein
VSNKPSPTGERIVAKPYPKDNEPRTFAVSQDWFEAVAEHNKLRNLGREDLLFSRDSRHAELPQHLPHPGLADSSDAVHVAPSDPNPNPADEHERASEGAGATLVRPPAVRSRKTPASQRRPERSTQ